ncbi:MAG: ribosome silencing factor [bacterium]
MPPKKVNDICEIVKSAANAALEKKAEDVVILDLRNICDFTDFFIICTGSTARHLSVIVDSIEEKLSSLGIKKDHLEGYPNSDWILADFSDLIVHVFTDEKREFYELEHLWGDAPRLDVVSEN